MNKHISLALLILMGIAICSPAQIARIANVGQPNCGLIDWKNCKVRDVVRAQWTTGLNANGHWYEAVYIGQAGISWTVANVMAEALGGYLVTLESKEENDFVFELIKDPRYWYESKFYFGPWIGASRIRGDYEVGGGWQWVKTNEVFAYTNWATYPQWNASEPNNWDGAEQYVHFYGIDPDHLNSWNDESDTTPIKGFVVEYDQMPARNARNMYVPKPRP
jgi:hypothetical protein